MLQIHRDQLLVLSRVLLSRLTRPNLVEVNIIEDYLKYDSTELSINIKSTFGRFVGCFYVTTDQSCCFYLLARKIPDGEISHVYIYYLNSSYEQVHESELDLLKRYVPNIIEPDGYIKVGMINIIVHSDQHYYLSLFLEAIEHSLGPHLINDFKPLQIIDVEAELIRIFPSNKNHDTFCSISQVSLMIKDT